MWTVVKQIKGLTLKTDPKFQIASDKLPFEHGLNLHFLVPRSQAFQTNS